MNEQLGQSLSALMDDEASDQDIEQVLDHLHEAPVREAWQRYQRARASLTPASGVDRYELDLSSRISAAIEQEPALEQEAGQPLGEVPIPIQSVGRWQRFSRPLASVAVAASVFAAVLVGTQFYGTLDAGPAGNGVVPPVAGPVASGGVIGTLDGTAVRADFAAPDLRVSQPVSDYDALAQDRLQRYLLPHTEEAALNGNQGMLPFAKVASFETED